MRLAQEISLRLVLVGAGLVGKAWELAVSGGLALVSVGTGRLLLDGACRDLGEAAPQPDVAHPLAA